MRSKNHRASRLALLASVAALSSGVLHALPTQHRARISVVAPEATTFTVEATLPVPPGTVAVGASTVPLALASGGITYPTQLEIVSRYPAPADGADVVELIARVERPAGVAPGEDMFLQVVDADQTEGPFTRTPAVNALLTNPDGLVLTARDPFSNFYSTDIVAGIRQNDPALEVVRSGPHLVETHDHHVMMPGNNSQTGPLAPYPHLMGVHSFVRTYADEDFVIIDLLVHNGMAGHTASPADDPVHHLYFNQLDLQVPAGWRMGWAFDQPFIGRRNPSGTSTSYAIVDALPTQQFHVLPQQSQFVRRLLLARGQEAFERGTAVLRRETRGFARPGPAPAQASTNPADDDWSWWNAATSRFLTSNTRLPHLDHVPRSQVIQSLQADFEQFADQVRTGAEGPYPTYSGNLGWAHPWGVDYGGMTGGDEIEMFPEVDTAWARHPIGVRWMELRSRAYIDRQPIALFDLEGRPPILENHLVNAGQANAYMPYSMYLTEVGDSNYFGLKSVDLRFAEHTYMTGTLPEYQKDLTDFQPIDLQHYTRFLNPHLGLIWLANDSLAKLEIELSAHLFRSSFHQYANNQYNYIQGTGLKRRILDVGANPGQGANFGRGPAWGLIAATAHYAVADNTTRNAFRPWFGLITDIARNGQSHCTGNPAALPIERNFKGVYQSRQSFEVGFMLNAAHSIRTSVFEGLNPVYDARARDYVVDGALSSTAAPYWNDGVGGQISLIAVRPRANDLPEFCLNTPENGIPNDYFIDRTTAFPSWVYAYEATSNGVLLQRATRAVQHSNLLIGLEASGTTMLADIAPMLALVQSL